MLARTILRTKRATLQAVHEDWRKVEMDRRRRSQLFPVYQSAGCSWLAGTTLQSDSNTSPHAGNRTTAMWTASGPEVVLQDVEAVPTDQHAAARGTARVVARGSRLRPPPPRPA